DGHERRDERGRRVRRDPGDGRRPRLPARRARSAARPRGAGGAPASRGPGGRSEAMSRARRWVVATGNPGKLAEIRSLLSELSLELVAQAELGVEPADEPAPTFVENALLKARHAARGTGLPALADDSGLAVDALGGLPGVRSARFA